MLNCFCIQTGCKKYASHLHSNVVMSLTLFTSHSNVLYEPAYKDLNLYKMNILHFYYRQWIKGCEDLNEVRGIGPLGTVCGLLRDT